MNAWALIVVFVASALAVAMAYSASPYQRQLRKPLAAFPACTSAVLAAVVALRAWVEAVGILPGFFAWLATVVIVIAALLWMTARAASAAAVR